MRPAGCVERCPACGHRDLSANLSAITKLSWAAQELEPWSSVLAPLASPSSRWFYRRKALLHARWIGEGWGFGMIRFLGREEEFIPIPQCPLHASGVNEILQLAARLVPREFPLAFVLVSGNALTLVLKCTRQDGWPARMKEWQSSWPADHSLFVNWNPGAGKRALDSRRTELVFGQYWRQVNGFWHGPSAFRQQIPQMEEAALDRAEDFLAGAGKTVAADLFCGLGASLRRWLARGWDSAGVELSGESVEAAAKNAPAARLLRGRVEDRLPQLDSFLGGRGFVVYTNPPRSGHGAQVLRWLLTRAPERMAYLSCHPRSLAGDLSTLDPAYRVERILPLDFFPQTSHLECLALLVKK